MLNDLERISEEASGLDRHSQFILAERLVRNLREQPEHKEAWSREAKRRIEAYDKGEMSAMDASEALSRVRTMLKR